MKKFRVLLNRSEQVPDWITGTNSLKNLSLTVYADSFKYHVFQADNNINEKTLGVQFYKLNLNNVEVAIGSLIPANQILAIIDDTYTTLTPYIFPTHDFYSLFKRASGNSLFDVCIPGGSSYVGSVISLNYGSLFYLNVGTVGNISSLIDSKPIGPNITFFVPATASNMISQEDRFPFVSSSNWNNCVVDLTILFLL